jgi:two-component system, NtrC family, response regulator HydG
MVEGPHGDETSTLFRPTVQLGESTAYRLTVVEGPDAGRSFHVDGATSPRLLFGQSPACELRVADPAVSRRHGAFELAEGRLRYTDLESTNGSFVDGVPVIDAWLVGGSALRAGATVLRVEKAEKGERVVVSARTRFGGVVGASAAMRRIYPLCEKLARSDVPVVVEGETGTGKEVLAESLHTEGPRAQGPFVVFDCTAVAPNLVEAELFGHERGAFTGAVGQRKGVFEQAHGGTLLIDEIGDLELSLQPKLLRRVGGDRSIRVDVRVVAATRRDLDREVAAGRFRDDLFHRLAVTRVELPPLRRRVGDVGLLARHFLTQLGGAERDVPRETWQRWESDEWPGNVRELRNAVARQVALGELADLDFEEVGSPSVGDPIDGVLALNLPLAAARERLVAEFERRYVARVLDKHGGNISLAAAESGIARRYFQLIKARTK